MTNTFKRVTALISVQVRGELRFKFWFKFERFYRKRNVFKRVVKFAPVQMSSIEGYLAK